LAAHRGFGIFFALCAFAAVGCSSSSDDRTSTDARRDDAITIASFNFPESQLLARLYGHALQDAGFDVRFALDLGQRELVQPALARGLVDFVPEYAGTALQFLTLGAVAPAADTQATHDALVGAAENRGLVALAPAPAQDSNAFVVTKATAARYVLEDLSDLKEVAPLLTMGGPPECPSRPFCLAGLNKTYGLAFGDFVPLDVGGPLTQQALATDGVDIALLFSTDPSIGGDNLVALRDDLHLQPAENITPLVRREIVDRWGDKFVDAVDGVSSRLTTEGLRELNAQLADQPDDSKGVASAWLSLQALP
jgi:osmoprotectant transport system substrate-binding protein